MMWFCRVFSLHYEAKLKGSKTEERRLTTSYSTKERRRACHDITDTRDRAKKTDLEKHLRAKVADCLDIEGLGK